MNISEADVIRVERGNPTPEELAALVVALRGLASGMGSAGPARPAGVLSSEPSRWATYWRTAQATSLPNAWRAGPRR
jgi:Acyl-CoA carboxylase epsilon subunit